jgi:hypothetical protein
MHATVDRTEGTEAALSSSGGSKDTYVAFNSQAMDSLVLG